MSRHSDRIDGILAAFEKSQQSFVSELEGVDATTAQRAPANGGWNPAQIGWHVGVTNEMIAAMLTGEAPLAQLAPEDFQEQAWGSMTIPEKIQTFPQLEPPADIDLAAALDRLEYGARAFADALRSISADRASNYIVRFPFGTLSLYQLGEFAAAHNDRHAAQLKRALGTVPV